MDHLTIGLTTTPLGVDGWFVIRKLGLSTINLSAKFDDFSFSRSAEMGLVPTKIEMVHVT